MVRQPLSRARYSTGFSYGNNSVHPEYGIRGTHRLAEVRSLAVDPRFQKRGIAAQLVELCKRRARARGVRELFAVTAKPGFSVDPGSRRSAAKRRPCSSTLGYRARVS